MLRSGQRQQALKSMVLWHLGLLHLLQPSCSWGSCRSPASSGVIGCISPAQLCRFLSWVPAQVPQALRLGYLAPSLVHNRSFSKQFYKYLMGSCKNPMRRKVLFGPFFKWGNRDFDSQLVSLEPQLDLEPMSWDWEASSLHCFTPWPRDVVQPKVNLPAIHCEEDFAYPFPLHSRRGIGRN